MPGLLIGETQTDLDTSNTMMMGRQELPHAGKENKGNLQLREQRAFSWKEKLSSQCSRDVTKF